MAMSGRARADDGFRHCVEVACVEGGVADDARIENVEVMRRYQVGEETDALVQRLLWQRKGARRDSDHNAARQEIVR